MRLVQLVAILVGLAASGAHAAGAVWHRSAILDYQVAADGTSTATEIWEVRADTASVAHTIAQQSYSYVADLEDVTLVEAYTLKADGRRIPVPADSVMKQAVTTMSSAPQFSALASRSIVFPAVEAGDTVHYELRRHTKETLFPGQFTLTLEPGNWSVMDRADIKLTLPPGMTLHIAASGLDEAPSQPTADGGVVRSWHRSEREAGLVLLDMSSFSDYAALGRAYAAGAWPRSLPSPAVQDLADRLTEGVDDKRDIALRLYQYVASEIRYVATFLGNGRVVPRDAATVLADGWGDCKDHSALLQALLAAKGIEALPALISLRNTYTLPDAPGLGALDHVITYVPSLDLFLDSTAPYAPFGLLPVTEYDKPVILAHPTEARLTHTPAMPPDALVLTTRTRARLGEDDVVSGKTTTVASGPQGIALRSLAAWFEGRGKAYSASNQLQQLGTPGTGSFSFASPDEMAADYRIEGRFVLDDALADGGTEPFTMPSGLGVFGRPGKLLLNTAETEDGGHICYPGREVEEIELELPAGATVHRLPHDVDEHAGGASYTARYQVEDGVIRVHREFTVQTSHEFCPQAEFAPMLPVLAAARHDQQAQVTLDRSGPSQIAHGN